MSLSDDQIRRLARLARIAIGPEETLEVAGRLSRILALVDQMQAVDTAGVEPMSHALDLVQALRADEVTEPAAAEPRLYLVPRVIE